MEQSNEKDQRKKKVYTVTTFPVPFPLRENQEDFSIITNTPTKYSKEQAINQAFKFHSEGNFQEAEKHYRYFINQGCSDHKIFSNYGILLTCLGKLKEAELFLNKAIEINPYSAEAHYNLGIILRDHGKLQEAKSSLNKAIEINSDFA